MTRIEIIKDGDDWYIITPNSVETFNDGMYPDSDSLPWKVNEKLVELFGGVKTENPL